MHGGLSETEAGIDRSYELCSAFYRTNTTDFVAAKCLFLQHSARSFYSRAPDQTHKAPSNKTNEDQYHSLQGNW